MEERKSKVFAEAVGDFEFNFLIEKAEIVSPEDSFSIVGVASTPNIDHDMERMAEPALVRMANIINESSVPLRVEHQKNDNAIIGKVNEAWIDERKKLWIKAKLDRENPAALMLHNALKSGAKLGLSVGGRVKRASRELAEGAGKTIKTFYDVILDEVSVTPRPSNYDAWLVQKHYVEEGVDTKELYNTRLHDTFLFENPKFDYMLAIEKSIPNQTWKKVEPEINNDMKINKKDSEQEETKAVETDETKLEEEKLASVAYVDKKFADLTNLIKSALKKDSATDGAREAAGGTTGTEDALDQTNPEEVKPENPAQNVNITVKGANAGETAAEEENPAPLVESNPVNETGENPAQERTVTAKFIDNLMKGLKKAAEEAVSESSSSKTKPEAEKEISTDSSEKPEAEKAEEIPEPKVSEDGPTKGDEESSGSSKDDKEGYDLPEINRMRKNVSSMDVFASYVGRSIDDVEARLAKGGKRVPGLRQVILDVIRGDEEIQKSIVSMMKEPGRKQSVSFGTPYAVAKDGQRLKLVPDDAVIHKNVDPKAKFGDIYKAHFSSANDKNQLI